MTSVSQRESTGGTGGNKMRAARLSAQQFEVLIEFMQQHPNFAIGRAGGTYSKEEHDLHWKTLSGILNETPGPVKSVTKWQKCWVDLKSNARSRAAKWRAKSFDSSALPANMFTPWDERVLSLLSDIASSDNSYTPAVAQSPLQLLEVGYANGTSTRSRKHKFRSIATESILSTNGYHSSENGSETVESVGSQDFTLVENVHQTGQDAETLIAAVKTERDSDWLEEESGECEEDYSMDSMTPVNDLDSPAVGYIGDPLTSPPTKTPEQAFAEHHVRPTKRKFDDKIPTSSVEDSLERLSKKLCGTLDRMAAAAEEANAIQHGMVSAMNRLASTFEQLLPVVSRVLSKN